MEGVPEEWIQCLEPAQVYAVAAMTVSGLLGVCLFDEQGSGKTVMAIAAYDILKTAKSIDAMIIACPKTMMSEWPKDIERFLPGKYKIVVAEGNRQSRFQTALSDFDILVTNYEGIEHMRVRTAEILGQPRLLVILG